MVEMMRMFVVGRMDPDLMAELVDHNEPKILCHVMVDLDQRMDQRGRERSDLPYLGGG